jgi:hypothetical protein
MSADIINMKKKIIKKGKKRLIDRKQSELIYNELLDLCEDLQEEVTIPNMVETLQHFICDLAYDTAPSNAVATGMLLGIINHKLGHIIEEENEDE